MYYIFFIFVEKNLLTRKRRRRYAQELEVGRHFAALFSLHCGSENFQCNLENSLFSVALRGFHKQHTVVVCTKCKGSSKKQYAVFSL